jgi:hypothetical protein
MLEGNYSLLRNNGGLSPSCPRLGSLAAVVVAATVATAVAVDAAMVAVMMMHNLNCGRSGKTLAN